MWGRGALCREPVCHRSGGDLSESTMVSVSKSVLRCEEAAEKWISKISSQFGDNTFFATVLKVVRYYRVIFSGGRDALLALDQILWPDILSASRVLSLDCI